MMLTAVQEPCAPPARIYRSASVSVDAIIPEYWSEWTYRIPEELRGTIADGQLVWVPLRDRVVLGIVAALSEEPPAGEARPIHAVVEPAFCLSGREMNLATWISERYCCSLFHAAALMMPPGIDRRVVEVYRLTEAGRAVDLSTPDADAAQDRRAPRAPWMATRARASSSCGRRWAAR